ncbi:uncharacterized protein MELLADRAFT_105053 [Melampsora larici-populina 98AG31]|uniref:Secreted protein n=1 Tax=Melampsora larici-populina (strain 98AG31 / pathotype 3-4-7) TaxID=747676 RepID=F4RGY3_MELLP|nr:uncharacterized protein MELLADRAFT_105053 [Melampsora larici-populina 98AG31]EGG08131.1 hypothetical protein MELLADRAFT_105053 [Melampsora larici-populina 98AG31]
MKSFFLVILFFPSFLALPTPFIKSLRFQTDRPTSIRLARRHLLQTILPDHQEVHQTRLHKRAFSRMSQAILPGMRSGAQHLDATNMIPTSAISTYGRLMDGFTVPTNFVVKDDVFNQAVKLRQMDDTFDIYDGFLPQPGLNVGQLFLFCFVGIFCLPSKS